MREKYQIATLVGNGPDDCEWEPYSEYEDYVECIRIATELHESGRAVQIFDPFMGKTYDFPKDF